jgi:small subunit ribosomal protein S6
MAHLYDLMLLLDAAAPEDRRQEILAEVQQMIEDGGTIVGLHDWGNRRLSFEIDHRPDADYKLLQFEGENELLERLNGSLKIMDGVLRFRIIRQKPGGPPVPERPAPVGVGRREDEPDGRVAARAAADAAPEPEPDSEPEPVVGDAPAPADDA